MLRFRARENGAQGCGLTMTARRILYVVDDEAIVRASIISLVQAHAAYECHEYHTGDAFLAAIDTLEPGCVVLDLQLDGVSGATVMEALSGRLERFRMIVVTGFGDLAVAIDAFRAGAVDFLYKPYETRPLLDAIDRAFHRLEQGSEPAELVTEAKARIARLSPVEADIFERLIHGATNHDISVALELDARTVQLLRARALSIMGAPSIVAAIRTAMIAGCTANAGSARPGADEIDP